MNDDELDHSELTKIVSIEKTHFYFNQKRNVIKYAVQGREMNSMSVLDLSCSAGVDLRIFPGTIGMDYDLTALEYAKTFSSILVNGDANTIPFKNNTFDIVLAMDLLSVKSIDIITTIKEIHRILKPKGIVLVNLPSLQFMYSKHDVSGMNKRRYSRKDIKRMFSGRKWNIEFLSHWTMLLLPVVWVQRMVLVPLFYSSTYSDLIEIPSIVNSIMEAIYRLEFNLFKKQLIPAGLSLFARIRKNED